MIGPELVRTRLAIVGGGPSCTYAMERLAATAAVLPDDTELDIHVFDRTGQFGAGQVHSARQPVTSFLNRIVGQVAFAADETVIGAGPLLPQEQRPTLYEWCRKRFEETGDDTFDLRPQDWPKRYVHGLALQSSFANYVDLLRAHPRVTVTLHEAEVVDLVQEEDGFRVDTAVRLDPALVAQQVLMVTGHSNNDPRRSPSRRDWLAFAEDHEASFVASAYPLEEHFTAETSGPDRIVGCVGMGLTAIDIVLFLTEGRGGAFERDGDGQLRYRASGAEPRSIVVCSSAGLFTFARPYNAKEVDLARFEHRGVFLTETAVERLRRTVGVPVLVDEKPRYQIDFEAHVFPLVVLEMARLYYATLLGPEFGDHLTAQLAPAYERFLEAGPATESPDGLLDLLTPLEDVIDDAVTAIDGLLEGVCSFADLTDRPWLLPALRRYLQVTLGAAHTAASMVEQILEPLVAAPQRAQALAAEWVSPFGHPRLLRDNRFQWMQTIDPIPAAARTSPEGYRRALIAFMTRDHLWAAQDNLNNPAKAAADGVWRDLRSVLGHAVDFGGLTPASHRVFLDTYMRHHNRLANGAALEVMEKILALVQVGLVDVSAGPGASVGYAGDSFLVQGPETGARLPVDVLVDARVHPFDPAADVAPIYPALLRSGLIRKWRNPGLDGSASFEPGGLALTPDFHPMRDDGTVEDRVTFLGPPSEGIMFFQLGALRPQQNHHVMQDVLCWVRSFWTHIDQRSNRRQPVSNVS